MKRINLIAISSIIVSLFFTSCNDFLSQAPDNRTTLNTGDQISKILVSAYPKGNYSVLAELSSDNFIDNNSILSANLSSSRPFHDQVFAWESTTSFTGQDSPSYVWETCYAAISEANQALKAIDELEASGSKEDLKPQRGEALMCRAYSHFVLVNIFSQAYKDSITSLSDLGIPYITKPETKVSVNYSRGTVTSVYESIQNDIESGINLISDQSYKIKKYHFNKKAACAFASRFYLYKRNYPKVVEYATKVVGDNPSGSLRDWSKNYITINSFGNDYINSANSCNLMLIPTQSTFFRVFGSRYGLNGDALSGSIDGTGPNWGSFLPCFTGKLYVRGSQDYGVFFPKIYELFEYTDKTAGIGYAHIVKAEFTTEETLLCRAEAYVYLNKMTEALNDLNAWTTSRLDTQSLTDAKIRSFYTSSKTLFVKNLNPALMSSNFVLDATKRPYIDCILHFRRIETVFDGLRWFDIKRYGMIIEHKIGKTRTETLNYNDSRRAIQIPQEIISAGIEANPETTKKLDDSELILIN